MGKAQGLTVLGVQSLFLKLGNVVPSK